MDEIKHRKSQLGNELDDVTDILRELGAEDSLIRKVVLCRVGYDADKFGFTRQLGRFILRGNPGAESPQS